MNKLFNRLVGAVRKQTNSSVVPFSVGRIYQCRYKNFKHDPRPLILIIGSDSFYTVGINLHYVSAFYSNLENWIIMMRNSKKVLTGKVIYDILKMRLPMVPRTAYRKYYTSMLHGKLVSSGLYTGPENTVFQFAADPFVKRLNNRIKAYSVGKSKGTMYNQEELEGIRGQINASNYDTSGQQPFANRTQKSVVQYRPQEQTGATFDGGSE